MVNCICDTYKSERQVAPCIVKGVAKASHTKGLAWCAAAEQVGRFNFARQDALRQRGHVAKVGDIGVVVGQHRRREWLNL